MCVLVNNHSHAELELCYSLWLLYLYTQGRKLEFTIFFTYTRHYFLNHYLEWENFFNSNIEDILYIIHPQRVFRLTQVKSARNHFDSNLNDFVLFSLEDLIKLSFHRITVISRAKFLVYINCIRVNWELKFIKCEWLDLHYRITLQFLSLIKFKTCFRVSIRHKKPSRKIRRYVCTSNT